MTKFEFNFFTQPPLLRVLKKEMKKKRNLKLVVKPKLPNMIPHKHKKKTNSKRWTLDLKKCVSYGHFLWTKYRVSQKKVSLRFCIISRPPRGLEIPSLTFFYRLFCVDSRNIHFVIVWWNFDQDIAKILQGSHLEKLTIFVYYWIKNLNTQDHPDAFMGPQEHP